MKNMKYLMQFLVILFLSFLGELFGYIIPLPIPASIYGIVFLFVGLVLGFIPYDAVKDVGHFLVDIMPVMFIPAAVGLMDSWEMIQPSIIPYFIITLVTTIVVMGVAGRVTQLFTKKKEEKTNGVL